MKKTFVPWLLAVVGAVSFAAFAQAPTGTGAMSSSSMGTIGDTAKADKAFLEAQTQCNEKTGAARTTCLSDARATYDRAIAGKAGSTTNATTGAGTTGSAGATGAGSTSSSGTSGGMSGGGTTGGTTGATSGATGGASGSATGGATGSASGSAGGTSGSSAGGKKY